MAVVARILPRHWDGHRLLQFLTGLALIALSFAVRVDGPAAAPATVSAAPATAAVRTVHPEAAHTEAAEVDGDQAVRRPAATGPVEVTIPGAAVAPPVATAPAGDIPPSYGSRAPPAA